MLSHYRLVEKIGEGELCQMNVLLHFPEETRRKLEGAE